MHRKCVLPDQKHDKSQAPQTAVLFILFPCLTQNLTYHTAVGFGSGLGRDLWGCWRRTAELKRYRLPTLTLRELHQTEL